MEKSEAGIVGNEINLALLITAQHNHVLPKSRVLSKEGVGISSCGLGKNPAIAQSLRIAPSRNVKHENIN
jgi:hypothetical protein